MEETSLILDILEDVLGRPKRKNHYKSQYAFDCPQCSAEAGKEDGDGKGNLEVNIEKNAYKCWSCYESHDTHGNLVGLVKKWGNRNQYNRLLLLLPEEFHPQQVSLKKLQLPKEFIPFSEVDEALKMTHMYKAAYNYLKGRGITEEIISKHNIGFAYDGYYSGRIIIPSYDKDKHLNYFVARSYGYDKMKYKNPDVPKDIIIFNENLIDWNKDIYLVEGPFDSLFVENSIPLLGKFLSDLLWQRLYEQATADIYILLDGDAWASTEKIFYRLNGGKLHGRIKAIQLPEDKDIADLRGKYEEDWIKELEY